MLIGEFETKLTDKNRLALPKKFREELGSKVIITSGYEGCLIIVNEQMFTDISQEISKGRFINDSVRDLTRFLVGSAHEVDLDSQGRFVVPQTLKMFGNLNTDVIFLGLIRWIEIWNKDAWNKRKDHIVNNSSEIAEKLESSLKSNA